MGSNSPNAAQRTLRYVALAIGLGTIALDLTVRIGGATGLAELARYATGFAVLFSSIAMLPYAKTAAAKRESLRETALDRRTRDSLAEALSRIARNQ